MKSDWHCTSLYHKTEPLNLLSTKYAYKFRKPLHEETWNQATTVYTNSSKRMHSKCVSSWAGNTITNYLVSKEISTLALCGNTKAEAWNTLSRRPRLTVEVSWAAHRRLFLHNKNGIRYSKHRASVVNGFTAVRSLVRFLATV